MDPGDPPYYEHKHERLELDSHADTCCINNVAKVLQQTGRTVSVHGFEHSIGSVKDIDIVTAAVAYDCPTTFKTFILIFHECLYIPTLTTCLLNPNQMREQGITIHDVPLQHLEPSERTQLSHSIISDDPAMQIPMTLRGIMSGFTVREPTWEEIQGTSSLEVAFVHMTSSSPWDPTSSHYEHIEENLRNDLVKGLDRMPQESRDLSQLQARGQFEGTAFEGTSSQDCLFVEPHEGFDEGLYKHADLVSREAVHQEQMQLGALEVTGMLTSC